MPKTKPVETLPKLGQSMIKTFDTYNRALVTAVEQFL